MRAQEVEEAMRQAGAAGGLAPGAPALYGAGGSPRMQLRNSTSRSQVRDTAGWLRLCWARNCTSAGDALMQANSMLRGGTSTMLPAG
jgi:hypothetical protein